MVDQVRITNFPDSATKEDVAYRIWITLKNEHGAANKGLEHEVKLFSQVLRAVKQQEYDLSQFT